MTDIVALLSPFRMRLWMSIFFGKLYDIDTYSRKWKKIGTLLHQITFIHI
jgi:hypothetical protein